MHNAPLYQKLAVKLADIARPIAQRYFEQALPVELKADNSPVTQADREIEFEQRVAIRATFPNHGILGEEYPPHQPDAEWVWVLDPIDGTKAFIAGKATFVTLIALCQYGVPVLGVIDQPIKQERWMGGLIASASFNGMPIARCAAKALSEATISTTSMPYFSASEMALFGGLESQSRQSLLNLDGYAFGLLTKGEIDVVIEAGLKNHDFCALKPVIEAAGGVITDWYGNPLTMESDGHVLATNSAELHQECLTLMKVE